MEGRQAEPQDNQARIQLLEAEKSRRDRIRVLEAEKERRGSSQNSGFTSKLMKETAPLDAPAFRLGKNIAAGAVEGNVNLARTVRDSLIPDQGIAGMLTDIAGQRAMGPLAQTRPVQALSKNINELISDPYKKLGVEEAPFYTPSGLAQTLGKYFTGGEIGVGARAGGLISKAPEAASFLRKQFPHLLDAGTVGAGMELNEEKPTLKGAVEKGLLNMILPPVAKNIGSKLTESLPNPFDKLKDNISKTWDYLRPGKKIEEIGDHLKGENKRIDESVGNQIDHITQHYNKEKESYEDSQNTKIRDVNHDYDQQISHIDNTSNQQIKDAELQTKQQVKDLNAEVKSGTDQLNENLGQGMTNTEQSSRAISNDIRALHDPAQANASSYYEHVLGQADREYKLGKEKGYPGRGLLYRPSDPLISTAPQEGADVMAAIKHHGFGELGNKFKSEPTLRNAHNIKQEVGLRSSDIRSLGRNKTPEQRLELGQLDNLYNKLDKDMTHYLDNIYPNKNENLSSIWKQGDQIYQDQVLPFLYNKKLREINRPTKSGGGRKEYVKDIHEAFQHPGESDIQMPDGSTKAGPARKLLELLPEKTKNLILFNKLGSPVHENIEGIANSINKAKTTEGMSHYVTTSLEQHISEILGKKQMAKELPIETKSGISEMKSKVSEKLNEIKSNKSAHIESLKEDKSNKLTQLQESLRAHNEGLKDKATTQKESMKEEADSLIRPLAKRGNRIRASLYAAAGAGIAPGYYLSKNILNTLTGDR